MALSIDRSTLARWQREGRVTPAFVTAGGHARWDLEDLKRQIREGPPQPSESED